MSRFTLKGTSMFSLVYFHPRVAESSTCFVNSWRRLAPRVNTLIFASASSVAARVDISPLVIYHLLNKIL